MKTTNAVLKLGEMVEDSRAAGMWAARVEGFGLSDERRDEIVAELREALAKPSNIFAKAYAEGALDGLAPYALYA